MRWLAMAQWFVWSIEERRMYIYMHDCIAREELIDRRLPKHGKRRKRAASESTSSAYAWKGIDFVCLWNAEEGRRVRPSRLVHLPCLIA